MKELLNRLIALHKNGEKMQETNLLVARDSRTPQWAHLWLLVSQPKNDLFGGIDRFCPILYSIS